jgi:serine/threonine protein phosphatase PrpC
MIRTQTAHIYATVLSHPGMAGKRNEDRYAVVTHQRSLNDSAPSLFAILCDGIGGHHAGEVAAELAVNHICQAVDESDATHPIQTLQESIQNASRLIQERAQETDDQNGMGSTCACAWLIGANLYTASVGDSRIYLLRRNTLLRLSTDHTWIHDALEKGLITPEQAVGHPNRHVIRRYLGSHHPPLVDTRLRLSKVESDRQAEANQGKPLQARDVLLLCSDGLTDQVSDEEIQETLSSTNGEHAAAHLVDLACQRGGQDNISVILLQVPPDLPVPAGNLLERIRGWLTG